MLRFLLKLLNLWLIILTNIHNRISFSIYRSSFNEDKQVTVIKFDNQLEVCQVQSDLRMFSRFGTEFPRNSNILIPLTLQPDGVKLWYFKLLLFDITEFIVLKV